MDVVEALLGAGAEDKVAAVVAAPSGAPVLTNALLLACIGGHADLVELLLRRGHAPNYAPAGAFPPLLCAVRVRRCCWPQFRMT